MAALVCWPFCGLLDTGAAQGAVRVLLTGGELTDMAMGQ
jgi:hypothetical protein